MADIAAVEARAAQRRGWVTVTGGSLVQVLISAVLTQAFGGYVVLLRREFGWSNTLLAGAYALLRLESNLLGPIQGWLTDHFGPRRVMLVGVVMLGGGFMLLSRIDSPVEFYLAFVVIAVGSSFAGWTTLAVAIVRIFPVNRSWPMAMAKFGMGAGGLLAPIVLGMLAAFGWRTTAFITGAVVLVVGVAVAQLIEGKGRFVETQAEPDGDGTPVAASFTARQALRTRAFWMLSLGHTCAVLVVAAILVHLVPFLTAELGYGLRAASLVVAAMTAAQMVGTLVGGYFGDRYNRRWILTATMFMHGTGVLFLTYAVDLLMVVAFILLHGLAWGIRAPLQQSLRADYFGAASFGTILGLSSLLVMIGNSGGPLMSGYLVDRTGGYAVGFTAIALIAIAGSGFFFMARPPKPVPARRPQARSHPVATSLENDPW